jgi:hypothetical protein
MLAAKQRSFPYYDINDPNFKRIAYVRYADDWIILVIGSKKDAITIKQMAAELTSTLGLELSESKTKITNLMRDKAKFLGLLIARHSLIGKHAASVPTNVIKVGKTKTLARTRVTPNLRPLLPLIDILKKLKLTGFIRRNRHGHWFPISKSSIIMLPHWRILQFYNSKVRGLFNFYRPADNIHAISYPIWLLKAYCAITLARKFKIGQRTMSSAFKTFGKNLAWLVKTLPGSRTTKSSNSGLHPTTNALLT